MAARTIPARLVSGDLYDWAYRSPDELIITMADIAGKGLPAAMLASSYKTALRASVRRSGSPAELISITNEMLYQELSAADLFVTCAVLVVNTRAHTVRSASAGHTPLLILRRTGELEELPATGPPLGIVEKLQLEEHTISLEPGDATLIFSDGVTEATEQAGEFFGADRLSDLCSSLSRRTARHIVEATTQAVTEFRDDEPLSDDVSLVAISRNAAPDRLELEAELSSVEALLDSVEKRCDINETERYRCQLIASELLTNIIRHGYQGRSGRIQCELAIDERSIRLDVWEHGAPFEGSLADGSEIDPRELPVDEIPEGGYGMAILRTLCELRYNPGTPKGNHWRCLYRREEEV
jgi:anti-sigma regulatory factor (Ser/Thr protein kinase)